MISLSIFFILATAGIFAFSEASPTASIIIGFSDLGLLSNSVKNRIVLCVGVKIDSPALCKAVIKKPEAIPTLSGT